MSDQEDYLTLAAVLDRINREPWRFNLTAVGMGAQAELDYANDGGSDFEQRISRCYELAGRAFMHWRGMGKCLKDEGLPDPHVLIHGSWHGPGAPARINHAWVVLEDGRIWEPITRVVCDPLRFTHYTRAQVIDSYSARSARIMMTRRGHFGPWS